MWREHRQEIQMLWFSLKLKAEGEDISIEDRERMLRNLGTRDFCTCKG